ncbi:MAG: tRNA preQ1(34) S-adenosylmethionine ribosyltransferase-isomerase QueA [bacterium]
MRLSDIDFSLPAELIAQNPVEPRDQARLLVFRREDSSISHATVANLPSLLAPQTLIVANNTRVRHCRLYASHQSKTVEVLFLNAEGPDTYRCLLRGKGLQRRDLLRFQVGKEETTEIPLEAEIVGRDEQEAMTTFLLRLTSELPFEEVFARFGEVPLPPYITTSQARSDQYQTVFAGEIGSAAAPTAGLHFTPGLISRLEKAGHSWSEVTLNVGIGTFLPLRKEVVEENILHNEATYISPGTGAEIEAARSLGRPLLAVGTTSTRTLESRIETGNHITTGWSQTDMFIYPGYRFQAVDALLTNFHLPKSSLLLLVAAFLGNRPGKGVVDSESAMLAQLHTIYAEAIKERYRFFSFGDALLIL